MPEVFSYKTIDSQSEGMYKAKGSKFLAYAKAVFHEDHAKNFIIKISKLHYKARHVCYAYRIGLDGNLFRIHDAGEPSGTAGQPILGQIKAFGLNNIIVVVVRYFGGTKLGIGGLIRAYREASEDVLNKATIINRDVQRLYKLKFPYARMNSIMSVLKHFNAYFINQSFEEICELQCSVSLIHVAALEKQINSLHDVELEILENR